MNEKSAPRLRMTAAMHRSISERVAVLYGRELERWNRKRPIATDYAATLRSINQIN